VEFARQWKEKEVRRGVEEFERRVRVGKEEGAEAFRRSRDATQAGGMYVPSSSSNLLIDIDAPPSPRSIHALLPNANKTIHLARDEAPHRESDHVLFDGVWEFRYGACYRCVLLSLSLSF
jgi:hypothetical protein